MTTRFDPVRLIVRLLPEQRAALEAEAVRRGSSLADVVRGLVADFVDRSRKAAP